MDERWKNERRTHERDERELVNQMNEKWMYECESTRGE